MRPSNRSLRARGKGAAPALAVALLVASCTVERAAPAASPPGTPAPSIAATTRVATVPSTTAASTTAPPTTAPQALPPTTTTAPAAAAVVERPVTVDVPAVDITAAPLVPLGLDDEGALEVPADFDVAGWYAAGPEPGDPGPTVIVGHVDSTDGPAVFFRLSEVEPGDEVSVTGADGTMLRYVVRSVEWHPKDAFPTDAVYGPTPVSTLRLVTCGGEFDHRSRHYLDNVVVFADLAR